MTRAVMSKFLSHFLTGFCTFESCRKDSKKLEEWAAAQSGSGIADFAGKDGEVEAALKDIAERAAGKEKFHYSRFFAIGLFRLLECAKASDPAVLETVSSH